MIVRRRHPYPGLDPSQIVGRALQDIAPTSAGCIEWPYSTDCEGYGCLYLNKKRLRLHRIAYETANQTKIAGGLLIRHACDNPPCFNPDHLLIGTPKDNTWDMVDRGRHNHGERHHFTPFTEKDIRRIRSRHAAGQSIRALARETGVQKNAIANIVHRKSWRHVA